MPIVSKKYGHKEVHNTPFDVDYAVDHIKLPSNVEDLPQIIGWSGPARSGTTGLLYLLAGHPQIDRAYFQPIKTILRQGGPDFAVRADHKTICMKEVFRGCCPKYNHDPVQTLLKAGVPPHKIVWICIFREPVSSYESWVRIGNPETPDQYAEVQQYAYDLYYKYLGMGLDVVPLAYELFAGNEIKIVNTILSKVGLLPLQELEFDEWALENKIDYGQAKDQSYFDSFIKKTQTRKRFTFIDRGDRGVLNDSEKSTIKSLCQDRYNEFYEISKKHFCL